MSLTERSRRSSVDLLGGGGDGGWEGVRRGDLRGSRMGVRGSRIGVCGRLGILNVLGPVPGDEGCFTNESVFRKPGRSPTVPSTDLFGGDWGGSTRRDGGCIGRGLTAGRPRRVGESGLLVFAPSG
jgi:hypothetical protein